MLLLLLLMALVLPLPLRPDDAGAEVACPDGAGARAGAVPATMEAAEGLLVTAVA